MEKRLGLGSPRPEFKRFSDPTRLVFNRAMDLAEMNHNNYAGDGHLLLALMKNDSVRDVLAKLNLSRKKIGRSLDYYMTRLMYEEFRGEVKLTDTVYAIIGFAEDEAKPGKKLPSPIDLLMGITREGNGIAARALRENRLPEDPPLLDALRNAVSAGRLKS